jgi:predicted nucleotidyltransferase
MADLLIATQQALAFTMRDFATVRDFEAARAVLHDTLKAALEQPEQPCNCRWVGDVQTQQCTLHEAHVDAIHEWAERAKAAEAKLAALAAPIIKPEIKADKEARWLPMPWKGLTEEEHNYYKALGFVGVKAVEEKLRAKNSTLACIPAVPPG